MRHLRHKLRQRHRETGGLQKALPTRLPISSGGRNLWKQRSLALPQKIHTDPPVHLPLPPIGGAPTGAKVGEAALCPNPIPRHSLTDSRKSMIKGVLLRADHFPGPRPLAPVFPHRSIPLRILKAVITAAAQ